MNRRAARKRSQRRTFTLNIAWRSGSRKTTQTIRSPYQLNRWENGRRRRALRWMCACASASTIFLTIKSRMSPLSTGSPFSPRLPLDSTGSRRDVSLFIQSSHQWRLFFKAYASILSSGILLTVYFRYLTSTVFPVSPSTGRYPSTSVTRPSETSTTINTPPGFSFFQVSVLPGSISRSLTWLSFS